jgi:hypothetical protein
MYALNMISILTASTPPGFMNPPDIFNYAFTSFHCPIPAKIGILDYNKYKITKNGSKG